MDGKQAYEISLIENLQRNNLNPIEEAKAFRRYVDEYGYGSTSELARSIGKSEPYVSKRLALLDLPESVQEDLIRRRITPSVAEELMGLNPSEAADLAGQIAQEGITRHDVRRKVKELKDAEAQTQWVHGYAEEEVAIRRIERGMSKSIASLKVCLMQMDDVICNLGEDEWFVRKEALVHYRRMLHQFIDEMIALQKRGDSYSSFLVPRFAGTRTARSARVTNPKASLTDPPVEATK